METWRTKLRQNAHMWQRIVKNTIFVNPVAINLLQAEANLLKSIISGGSQTKLVALGIGSGVNQVELRGIASSPKDRNVILVQDFSTLPLVEELLRNESCRGNHFSTIYAHVSRTSSSSLWSRVPPGIMRLSTAPAYRIVWLYAYSIHTVDGRYMYCVEDVAIRRTWLPSIYSADNTKTIRLCRKCHVHNELQKALIYHIT